jgi:anti-sigma factor RsiW
VIDRAGGLTHEQAWELLPWLVNDTLEAPDREEIAAHLAACRDCRAEVERCRSLQALVRAAEVAPSPHPAQLARLMQRVDMMEKVRKRSPLGRFFGRTVVASDQPQPSSGTVERAFTSSGGRRTNVWWALTAQAAALVVLLAVILWPPPPKRYVGLGDPEPAAVAVRAQHQVRVVFTPTTTEAELRRALLEVHGEVVAGPTPFGAYTIAVPADPGAEPLSLVLEHLRADPHVRFAEPVAGAGG